MSVKLCPRNHTPSRLYQKLTKSNSVYLGNTIKISKSLSSLAKNHRIEFKLIEPRKNKDFYLDETIRSNSRISGKIMKLKEIYSVNLLRICIKNAIAKMILY